MKTKTSKRYKVLTATDENSQAEAALFQVEQDALQLNLDLLETRKQLASTKQQLEVEKSAPVLSPVDVIRVADQVKSLEAGVQALEDLRKELF